MMNRRQRRQADAQARKPLTGDQHRLRAAVNSSPTIAGVMDAIVEHDGWWAIYAARRVCTCSPNISLIPVDGGDGLYVIDERGKAHRTSKQ